jgi:ribose transport system substrate-binding protein
VTVIGYDALDEAKTAVRAGRLAVTVDQQAAEQGYQGIATAVRMLHGETVPEQVKVNTALITAANLK